MSRTFLVGCLVCQTLVAAGPIRQVISEAMIMANQPVPAFHDGFVYWIESGNTALRVYAADGHSAGVFPIGGLTSNPTLIANFAVDTDGTIAISRSYGGGDATPSAIDLLDTNGRLIKTINTGVFAPAQITFARPHRMDFWLGMGPR